MDAETLRRLEFDRVASELARRACWAGGAEVAAALAPRQDLAECERLQEETAQARAWLEAHGSPPLRGLRDVRAPLGRARRGATLTAEELVELAGAVESLAAARAALAQPPAGERLRDHAAAIPDAREVARAIRAVVAEDATVRDDASPALRHLRQRRRVLQAALRQRLEALLRSPAVQPYLQEPIITWRAGRAVLPVRSEHRNRVEGIVHDQSGSGATVFVEPLAAVEAGNRLREVELAEEREVARLLAELSRQVAAWADALLAGLEAAARLDAIFARAQLAIDWRCTRPALNTGRAVALRGARHPLLGGSAVPIDIRVGADFDTLVITGPNTGGKTVALKTLGLFVLMAQSGLQLPAASAECGVFGQVFADIGDEQSLLQSLSTFASHMRTLVEMVRRADPRTLVLIDELGAGTDPEEGAALGLALLDGLRERGARVVVTTHLGRLKTYAYEQRGVANASVAFDLETLRPAYRLLIGVPGRSHALTIARRLGLPEPIARRAEAYLGASRLRVEEAIARLEEQRQALERERQLLGREREEFERRRATWEAERLAAEQRRREWLERVRGELTARLNRLQDEAERLVDELRRAQRERSPQPVGEQSLRRLQALRDEAGGSLTEAERAAGEADPPGPTSLRPPGEAGWREGMTVWVRSLGRYGTLVDPPHGDRPAVVQLGPLRARVEPGQLVAANPPAEERETGQAQPAAPAGGTVHVALARTREIEPELHLRGLRVDEALQRLDKYLDDAVLAGLRGVRVVHGKGTGTLRSAVHDFLRRDPRVRGFRLGAHGEGGAGVTVVEVEA